MLTKPKRSWNNFSTAKIHYTNQKYKLNLKDYA